MQAITNCVYGYVAMNPECIYSRVGKEVLACGITD